MPPAMRDRLAGSEATVGGDERRCARRWRAATRPGAHRDRGATTVLRGPGEAGRSWPQAADRDHRLVKATSPVSGTSSSPAMAARSATSTTTRRANHGRSPIVRGPRRRAHRPGRGVARAPGAPSSAHRRRRRRHIRLAARSRSASYARPSKGHARRPLAATSSLGPRPRSHGMQAQDIQDRRTRSAYGARMTSSRRTAPSPVPRNRRPPRG
jgi:hypothetical protein